MPLNLQHYFKDTLQPMLHNEIEQSVLTAQKLALESLRKDGLVVESTPLKYKVLLDNDKDKLEVTIKFTIEV